MIDKDAHKLLALFGDKTPHSFFETAKLGSVLLKVHERKLEQIFKRQLLDNGWIRRLWNSWDPRLDMYELTVKGDECFRAAQISRLSRGSHTDEMVRHYRHFNRQLKGKYGVEGMGKEISEKSAGLREMYPGLYGR